ncbi:hypothetical protein ACLOJK_028582 [Asimina triloba]
MEKIKELESDLGELVGCVSELKDYQMAEFMRWKLASQAELRQMNEKIRRLEEAECKGAWKMDLINRNQALHTALFFIIFAILCGISLLAESDPLQMAVSVTFLDGFRGCCWISRVREAAIDEETDTGDGERKGEGQGDGDGQGGQRRRRTDSGGRLNTGDGEVGDGEGEAGDGEGDSGAGEETGDSSAGEERVRERGGDSGAGEGDRGAGEERVRERGGDNSAGEERVRERGGEKGVGEEETPGDEAHARHPRCQTI